LSGGVNWLIDGLGGKRSPAIDFAYADLTGRQQRSSRQVNVIR